MAKTKVEVSIEATPPKDTPGKVTWGDPVIKFSPSGNGHAVGKNIHLTEEGDAEITFDLRDSSGLHLSCKEPKQDAIWIATGTTCPTGPGDGDGEFVIDKCQNTKVTIIDHNHPGGKEYCYALRFTSDTGLQVFDPIIKNRP